MAYRMKKFALAGLCVMLSSVATAQIFYKSPDFSGPPIVTLDPNFDVSTPGVTQAESDAMIIWNVRSALNLSGLQCEFEPMLDTADNYNAFLANHKEELAKAYSTVEGYFKRTKKPLGVAMKAFDVFLTRTISKYSTVQGQYAFCDVAARVGHLAKFVPRGSLLAFAQAKLPEFRNAVTKPYGEQQFRRLQIPYRPMRVPNYQAECFDKKGNYNPICITN
jgi:hypothetical protein